MSPLRVVGLTYERLPHPLTEPRLPVGDALAALAPVLAAGAAAATAGLTPAERDALTERYLCSTIVDTCFTSGALTWPEARARLTAPDADAAPRSFLNAYECASWGYALRHAFTKNRGERHVLVQILDANVYNLDFWVENPSWGRSGFGLATVVVENTAVSGPVPVTTGHATGANPLPEFLKAARQTMQDGAADALALPFFPAPVRALAARLLPGVPRLTDLHDAYGHCFGSDPWLALVRDGAPGKTYLACSLALNGYFAICPVTLAPDCLRRGPREVP